MKRYKNMKPFVALIGIGYWGKNILRNLYELKVLHTLYDTNTELLKERIKQYSNVKIALSLEEVLNNSEIKAVCVATPASTHYNIAKEVLLADKDVYVEKPLALTVQEGKKLVSLAKKNKKILMVGHILQYHPAVIKLKEIIGKGKLGNIYYIYSNRLNMGRFRIEENILWSFAPHDISAILMLLEEEPSKVSTFGGKYITKGICDSTLTTLKFKRGVKSHIFVNWLHPFKEQKLIVIGSKAMAVFDDLSDEKLFIYPHKIKWKEGQIPVAQKAKHYPVVVEKKEPLREEMQHFIECVEERKIPKTDGEEGLKVLKVLERADECLRNEKGD